jgi:molybdopterin molybdotransferase
MQGGFFNIVSPLEFEGLLKGFSAPAPEQVTPASEQVSLVPEQISLDQAEGRVLAQALTAHEDLPLTSRSSMDGYAVSAAELFGAGEQNPAYLEKQFDILVDENPAEALKPGHCAGIVTGAPCPEGADAVVMVEYTRDMGAGTIEIGKAVAPGENLMLKGEDAAAGQRVLKPGKRLRAQEVGLAAALGYENLSVHKLPRCAVLSTGDELVPVSETPRPGQVRDVNSHALAALMRRVGAEVTLYGIIKDDAASLTKAMEVAVAENDVVFVSGGSSVGVRDVTQEAIESLPDASILAHGIAVSPGKPTILGRVGSKAVWGLPGQVASAQVVMYVFGLPFLRMISGESDAFERARLETVGAELSRNIASKQGREDYIRVKLTRGEGGMPKAEPIMGKSGLLKTVVAADGLARVPADLEGIAAGGVVDVLLY